MLLANSLITDAIRPQRPKHCETRVLACARPARPQSQRSLKSLRGLRVAIRLSASALVLVVSPYRVAQDGLSLTLSPQAAWAQGNSGNAGNSDSGNSDSGNSGSGNSGSGNSGSGNSGSGNTGSGNSGDTESPGNSGNAPGNATDPGNAAAPQATDPNGNANETKALNVTPPTNPATALNPGNKPKTYINVTTGDRIEVRGASVGVVHSNGLSERIDGGHYEMRDAMGRTIIRRQAKKSDRARLLRMIE